MGTPADHPVTGADVALRALARPDLGVDRLHASVAAAVEAMGGHYGAVVARGRDGVARVVAGRDLPSRSQHGWSKAPTRCCARWRTSRPAASAMRSARRGWRCASAGPRARRPR